MRIDIKRIGMYSERVGWLAKEALSDLENGTEEENQAYMDFLSYSLDLLDELYNSEAEIRKELDRLLPEL